jgi:lysophospholipase L1-like esterase
MKKLVKFLSVALIVSFLIGLSFKEYTTVDAADPSTALVALGDSITTGYGLESFNIADSKNITSSKNFVTKLSKKLGRKAINFGVEGLDSTQLAKAILSPETNTQKEEVAQIKKAGIVTISIGGNNILQPTIGALNDSLGTDKNIYNSTKDEIYSAAFSLLFDSTKLTDLQDKVNAASTAFIGDTAKNQAGDFANIIATIKKLNPKAQIIVQTIYNPYDLPNTEFLNDAVNLMNQKIIKDSANGKNYKVADVYSAFSKAKYGTVLVNADSGNSFDPHPTEKGHDVIYTVLYYASQNKLPYNVKATITKGSITTKISEGMLIITVTPVKGYKAPKTISLTIGKGTKQTLTLTKGAASVPVASIDADMAVTAKCTK